MAMAYPGEKSSLSEHIARDSFLTALDDVELELKVREREPKDLDEAVGISQRIEVFRNTVESSTAAEIEHSGHGIRSGRTSSKWKSQRGRCHSITASTWTTGSVCAHQVNHNYPAIHNGTVLLVLLL